MSDIAERLRNTDCGDPACGKIAMEAADEIERMHALAFAMQNEFRAEIERLKTKLREIAVCHEMRVMRDIARAALEGK